MLIDAYCHFTPPAYMEYLEKASGEKSPWRVHYDRKTIIHNIDARVAFMDARGVDVSVFVPTPWIESAPKVAADPAKEAEAARVCNDALAGALKAAPGRLYGVAVVPTTDLEGTIRELDHAVQDLGFVGCEVAVGPTVKRVDDPTLEPLFARAVELDVPLWFHPTRPITYSDYADEDESKYFDWQTLGWLHDTSSAMIRVVFSGLFEKYPALKIITHHYGALIPLFANRMELGWEGFVKGGMALKTPVAPPYIDHFKKFYCDTATFGYEPLLLQQAHAFFGTDRVLFGSDTPFDPDDGTFLENAIRSVESLPASHSEKQAIFSGNAQALLKLNS